MLEQVFEINNDKEVLTRKEYSCNICEYKGRMLIVSHLALVTDGTMSSVLNPVNLTATREYKTTHAFPIKEDEDGKVIEFAEEILHNNEYYYLFFMKCSRCGQTHILKLTISDDDLPDCSPDGTVDILDMYPQVFAINNSFVALQKILKRWNDKLEKNTQNNSDDLNISRMILDEIQDSIKPVKLI